MCEGLSTSGKLSTSEIMDIEHASDHRIEDSKTMTDTNMMPQVCHFPL